MKEVVVVAPTIMPVSPQVRYGGVESLAFEFVSELTQIGYKVSIICTDASKVPAVAERIAVGGPSGFDEPGITSALISLRLQGKTDDPQVGWIDFSHSHQLGKLFPGVPHITPIWYDPRMMKPEEPKSNIVCLSSWQRTRFELAFQQDAQKLDPICINPAFYWESASQEERMVFVGKMHPHKGALEAVRECRKANIRLDVMGASGPGDDPGYANQVRKECDGTDIVFYGEVDHDAKRELIQRAGAMFYPVSYPEGYGEAHSHKMAEAMVCGTPCIAYDQGAMKEVIDEDTGFVIPRPSAKLPMFPKLEETRLSLGDLLQKCLGMRRSKVRRHALGRFSSSRVVGRWADRLRRVCDEGYRW